MTRRDQEKNALTTSLRAELEQTKTLYMAEGRQTDREVSVMNQRTGDLTQELEQVKRDYDRLSGELPSRLVGCPRDFDAVSKSLKQRREDLLKRLRAYLDWWSSRRLLECWRERQDILEQATLKVRERRITADNHQRSIDEQNRLRYAELGRLQNMSAQISARGAEAQKRNNALKAEIEQHERAQAQATVPEFQAKEIAKLRSDLLQLQQKASKAAIDLRMLQEATSGPSKGEQRYEDERMQYRARLKEMVLCQREIDNLKKENEALNIPFGASRLHLSKITDVRLMTSEDREITFVQAAPLDLLAELLFYPGNSDPAYAPGLLVLLHTEKIELPEFVTAVCRAYESTEYAETRNGRVQTLIDKWRAWFPNDLTDSKKKGQMMPIFQRIGSAGIFDVATRSHDACQFDAHVPIDAKARGARPRIFSPNTSATSSCKSSATSPPTNS
jgi:hypothetical protein